MPPRKSNTKSGESLVFVINTGVTTNAVDNDGVSFLDNAKTVVQLILQREIFICPKDEITIIVIGSEETENGINISNIKCLYTLRYPEWEMVETVLSLKSTNKSATWIDGICAAFNAVQDVWETLDIMKVLLVINDFQEDPKKISQRDVNDIVKAVKKDNIRLLIMTEKPLKVIPRNKLTGSEKIAVDVCKEVGGQCMTFKETIPDLRFYKQVPKKSIAWNVYLKLADICIPVAMYLAVTTRWTLPEWRSMIQKKKEEFLESDSQAEYIRVIQKKEVLDIARDNVKQEDLTYGYKYGGKFVPFNETDEEAMQYSGGAKCFSILAFASRQEIDIEYWVGDGSYIVVPQNESAEAAFYSLVNAMCKKGKELVAIVRRVYSYGNIPKLGVLIPRINVPDEPWGFIYIEIPYAEDLRVIQPKPLKSFAKKLSKEQDEAVDKMIDAMMLTDSKNPEASAKHSFLPGTVHDPSMQNTWNLLAHRALHPNDILPNISEYLTGLLEPPAEIKDKAAPIFETIKQLFPFKSDESSHDESNERIENEDKKPDDCKTSEASQIENVSVTEKTGTQQKITASGSSTTGKDNRKHEKEMISDIDFEDFKIGEQQQILKTMTDVYDDLYLYATPEKFYVEPVGTKVLLVVDRVSQQIYTQVGTANQIPPTASRRKIWGIVGSIQLLACKYLIVITDADVIGMIAGQRIFKIVSTEIVPYTKSTLHLSEKQQQNNSTYLEMIRSVLNTPYFYFSYTYDLTHTMQRLHNTTPEFLQMPLHDRADPRFVWNAYLLQDLTSRPEQFKFCLPIIHGFVSLNTVVVNGIGFNWGVVSRRSVHRAGTRLFSRGIDSTGNVSNYVETEQLIEVNGDRSSFVQTRGSIPLFWHQSPNLKYKPKPQLSPHEDHQTACARHFDAQIFHYGKQILVNLIDHRGAEGELERAYRDMVSRIGNANVKYEAFDFHAECRHMRWDRLNVLMDRLAHDQEQMGFFLLTRDGALLSAQDGTFRTNCIDCLDRTNVVQSMLAKRVLEEALRRLGVLRKIEDHPSFESLFKQIWADNADVISTQYSGTGALKTDFTRTGKRTKIGAIRDGINSLTRYYKNNFADGWRQDSLELFLGRYVVQESECLTVKSPLDTERNWRYATFPLVLLIASSMLVAHIILPSRYTTEVLLYMLFWGGMVAGTFATIIHHGKQYVDKPKLT